MRYAISLQSFVGRHEGIKSYLRVKLTRSTLKILCDLSVFG